MIRYTDCGDDDDDIAPLPLPVENNDFTSNSFQTTPINGPSKNPFETLKNPVTMNPFETPTNSPSTNPFNNPFGSFQTPQQQTPQQQTPPSLPPLIPQLDLSIIKRRSSSRPNFSKNLIEWVRHNVSGTRGKDAINQDVMSYVKTCTFYMYPAQVGEDLDTAWRQCIRAIDAGTRAIIRKKKI